MKNDKFLTKKLSTDIFFQFSEQNLLSLNGIKSSSFNSNKIDKRMMKEFVRYDSNDFSSMVLSNVKSILNNNNNGISISINDSYFYDKGDIIDNLTESGNFINNNYSTVQSDDGKDNYWALLALILVFGTACGNILVCLAIAWEKRLQNVTNYFLASLALTDLMVAVLVMPLGIVTLYRGKFSHYCL
jgi:hypothetical protein